MKQAVSLAIAALTTIAALAVATGAHATDVRSRMEALSEPERTRILGGTVNSADYACRPTSSLYQGTDRRNSTYYSVTCDNGHSYQVQIKNDDVGSTEVVDCAVYRALGDGDSCLKTFKEQDRDRR